MNLSHFSTSPISSLYSCRQPAKEFFKPRGLWVSVDGEDDWESWCKIESFANHDFYYRYKVNLVKDANILYLPNDNKILDFSKKYEINKTSMSINWPEVAKEYGGIIITPYSWSLRGNEEAFWYYSWDCASGCIWDKDCVENIELLRKPIEQQRRA